MPNHFAIATFVTLNLFQGPWMLNQVQHDGVAL